MASQSAPRLLAELAAHSLQLALVDAGGRLVGYRKCGLDAAAVATAIAELSPGMPATNVQALLVSSSGFVMRAGADEAASMRTAKSLLARAEAAGAALTPPLNVVAFDSATGLRVDTVGATPWVLTGIASDRLDAAKAQLETLGLPAAKVQLALPVRIGSVVAALQDMPESTRVLVWQVGEADSQLACVSAAGCEAVGEMAAGFPQIFEAVQAGLGLKFRAAATKLFFNADYDFSETAGPIAERLAALLRPAIDALGCAPTTLHVAGLPEGQAWLAKALAAALELAPLNPDMAAFCAQLGLKGDGVNAELPVSALSLLFQASGGGAEQAWQPVWLDANAPVVVPPPAPAPAPKAVEPVAPAPAPAPTPVPAPAPAPVAKAPVAPKPTPVAPTPTPPAPKPAAPAVAVAAAKPAPAPVKSAPVAAPAKAAVATKPAPAVAVAAQKSITPAPVIKPAAVVAPVKAEPVLFIKEDPVVESVAEEVVEDKPQSPAKKAPVMLFAAIGAVVLIGGAAAFFMTKGKAPDGAAAPAVTAASSQAAEADLRMKQEVEARMLVDEMKTPRSFRNERYSFEVSDRGVLQKLVGVGNRTIIDEFGWLELQGTFTGTSKPFYAGTIGDKDYVPSIKKTVRDGRVVFEITGQHPRFTIETLVTCLPTSLRIHTVFNPINMEEPRGPISGVYTVKMNRQSLSLGQRAVVGSGTVSYSTQSGPVTMKFNGDAWGQAGEAGKQTIAVGSNLVFFYFAGGNDPKNNVLTTELTLP